MQEGVQAPCCAGAVQIPSRHPCMSHCLLAGRPPSQVVPPFMGVHNAMHGVRGQSFLNAPDCALNYATRKRGPLSQVNQSRVHLNEALEPGIPIGCEVTPPSAEETSQKLAMDRDSRAVPLGSTVITTRRSISNSFFSSI
jgi:hypothetical protein